MAKFVLKGTVLPRGTSVTVSYPSIRHDDPDGSASATFMLSIKKGDIRIECDVKDLDPVWIPQIISRASDLVAGAVNVLAFERGVGLSSRLERIVQEDGTDKIIMPSIGSPVPLCTAYRTDQKHSLQEVLHLVVSRPSVALVFSDLVDSLTNYYKAPINCARAIEGIRSNIVTEASDRGSAWLAMQNALHVDQKYISLITEASKALRYGNWSRIDVTDQQEITHRSWVIMNRFLHYKLRGDSLPESDFPTLRG